MNRQRWTVLAFGVGGVVCAIAYAVIAGTQESRVMSYGADAPEAQLGWLGEAMKIVTGLGGVGGILGAIVAFVVKWQPQLTEAAGKLGLGGKSLSYVVDVISVGRIAVQAKLYSEATSKSEKEAIRNAALIACDELMDGLFPISSDTAPAKGGV